MGSSYDPHMNITHLHTLLNAEIKNNITTGEITCVRQWTRLPDLFPFILPMITYKKITRRFFF